jgi:uncharacterized repeat protein (TIGR03803 family)
MNKMFVCAIVAVVFSSISLLGQQQFDIAYSFGANGVTDGTAPNGGLVFDKAGNLYGTTRGGGNTACAGEFSGCGTVFKLSPAAGGAWTESVIYRFCLDFNVCSDGYTPWAGLAIDGSGNLFGSTVYGGTAQDPYGTVFELSPNPDGSWTHTTLWNFSFENAWAPYGKLILDSLGNLYGTTYAGGDEGDGTVFELSPSSVGSWTMVTLHSLDRSVDGQEPYAGVAFDRAGNLYGTTWTGGDSSCDGGFGCGSIFELSPNSDGTWSESMVYLFSYGTGGIPWGEVNFDEKGNLYTTVSTYGPLIQHQDGGVFRMTRSGGSWGYSGTYPFNGADGDSPWAGVAIDSRSDTMYGTTLEGGPQGYCAYPYGCGTVFKIRGGRETVLHNFCSEPGCTDGMWPWSSLFPGIHEGLFGATWGGGTYGRGVVFELLNE